LQVRCIAQIWTQAPEGVSGLQSASVKVFGRLLFLLF
jgi:hypothetical protein